MQVFLLGFRHARKSKCRVRHRKSVPTTADGNVTQTALQRSNLSRNIPDPGIRRTQFRSDRNPDPSEASPKACLFAPGRFFSPRFLQGDGPGYPPSRAVFRKKRANSKTLQKACLFASSTRGEEPSSRPRGPGRGRFSKGFSLRAGRSDGVGYSKGSISSFNNIDP